MREQIDTETIVAGIRTGRKTRSGNRYHAPDGRFAKKIEAYDKLLDTLIPKNISYFKRDDIVEPLYDADKNRIDISSFEIEDNTVQSWFAHELSHALDHLNALPSRIENELDASIESEGKKISNVIEILAIDVEKNRNKIHELIEIRHKKQRGKIDKIALTKEIADFDAKHPRSSRNQEEIVAYGRMKDALKSALPKFFSYLDETESSHGSKYWLEHEENRPQEFFANVTAAFFYGDEKTLEMYERFFPASLSIVEKRLTDLLPVSKEQFEKVFNLGGKNDEN